MCAYLCLDVAHFTGGIRVIMSSVADLGRLSGIMFVVIQRQFNAYYVVMTVVDGGESWRVYGS